MKKIRLSFLLTAVLCIFMCIVGCTDNHYDNSKTLLAQSDEVKPTDNTTENDDSQTLLTQSDEAETTKNVDSQTSNEVETTEQTTEKEHSQPEINSLQNYYRMWCDGEITADELMNKPGVMDSFIETIKATTGYDLYNENFTWTYIKHDDRYPFKFIITDEDGIASRGIEAVIISYKDSTEDDVKYALEVAPYVYDPYTLKIIEYH